ncbi:hypothetical protein [Thiothrix winogradskyi]|uniref:Uncharacterized protein n=1 Tax=Thiothrix winogradskyi TaxID=96472 RepID=A0ABY3T5Z8_9GAMM|nr:hypothetical protein [Thiothrix winogradskyi]UJS26270.1 hypothetical protein L2Y54_09585 [Thiothrix winogradskyi]
MGALFAALLLWLAAVAGLWAADQYAARDVGAAAVAAPGLACPAPVVDVDRLAQVCMDFHNKPKAKK